MAPLPDLHKRPIAPVGEASVKAFIIKDGAALGSDCLELYERCDGRPPSFCTQLYGSSTFSLELCNLWHQQFKAGEFAP
jgi:hypothetical protein